jgi:hypothetical protein
MLVTFSVLIFIIWLAAMVTANTLGGLIHLFLILALIALFVEFLERHGPS